MVLKCHGLQSAPILPCKAFRLSVIPAQPCGLHCVYFRFLFQLNMNLPLYPFTKCASASSVGDDFSYTRFAIRVFISVLLGASVPYQHHSSAALTPRHGLFAWEFSSSEEQSSTINQKLLLSMIFSRKARLQ